jgi:Ca2+-binding RTX toxin-like protein
MGAIGLALSLASSSSAATVEASGTEDEPPTLFITQGSEITIRDAGAEDNALTLSMVGPDGGRIRYSVRDSAAPLVAGTGCTGGGPPGSEVTCLLPLSRAMSGCHHAFCADGGRRVSFTIELGGGVNSFDSSSMPASDGGTGFALFTTVLGGPEADTIISGAGPERVEPGAGPDVLHTGDGSDAVVAAHGAADAADLFDLGPGTSDTAYYDDSTLPLVLSLDGIANDGAAGEGDNLIDVEQARGGPADDVLSGSESADMLFGGPGQDRIEGNGGDDEIDGFSGDDSLGGGSGADEISGGQGADRIADSDGDDHLRGDSGRDRLSGGAGNDLADGGVGADRVRGNSGSDRVQSNYPGRDDAAPDRLDCGSGDDRARAGEGDATRHCEFIGPLVGQH